MAFPHSDPHAEKSGTGRAESRSVGTWLVLGLLLLGMTAALTGVWFQRHQTRRCLAFYGAFAARRITTAPAVELLLVEPGSGPGRLVARERLDVSQAPGLVHLRRGLVEDANFSWQGRAAADPAARLPTEAWDAAIVFRDGGQLQGSGLLGSGLQGSGREGAGPGQGVTTLVIALDSSGGAVAVVGQPGRVGLGRIGPGLEKWIRSTLAEIRSKRGLLGGGGSRL